MSLIAKFAGKAVKQKVKKARYVKEEKSEMEEILSSPP